MEQKTFFSQGNLIIITSLLGIFTGWYSASEYLYYKTLMALANSISKIFIDLLQLISIPIIFLSIASTISNMKSFEEMRELYL